MRPVLLVAVMKICLWVRADAPWLGSPIYPQTLYTREADRIRELRKNKTRVAETGGGGKRQKLREREPW